MRFLFVAREICVYGLCAAEGLSERLGTKVCDERRKGKGATDVAVTNNRYIATPLHRYIRCILMYCQKSAENETIE